MSGKGPDRKSGPGMASSGPGSRLSMDIRQHERLNVRPSDCLAPTRRSVDERTQPGYRAGSAAPRKEKPSSGETPAGRAAHIPEPYADGQASRHSPRRRRGEGFCAGWRRHGLQSRRGGTEGPAPRQEAQAKRRRTGPAVFAQASTGDERQRRRRAVTRRKAGSRGRAEFKGALRNEGRLPQTGALRRQGREAGRRDSARPGGSERYRRGNGPRKLRTPQAAHDTRADLGGTGSPRPAIGRPSMEPQFFPKRPADQPSVAAVRFRKLTRPAGRIREPAQTREVPERPKAQSKRQRAASQRADSGTGAKTGRETLSRHRAAKSARNSTTPDRPQRSGARA